MEITHEPLHLDKRNLAQFLFDGAFEYGDDEILKLLRWTQKLVQSASDLDGLYLQMMNNF
jgi:hypothetical protein